MIPNLLVDGIPAAIRSSPALKAYFVNLMWQPGETMEFRASDHVRAIHRHAHGKLLDYAVVNTRPIRGELKTRYARADGHAGGERRGPHLSRWASRWWPAT